MFAFNLFDDHLNFRSQTPLDSDEFGWNLSTSDAHPNKQEEETPADVTVEYHVRTNDEPNPKQFAEQPTSTSRPSECENHLCTGFF
jgi:hypothetical protein